MSDALRSSWIPTAALALLSACSGPDFDRRLAADADGELSVDIELGGGLSFDKGSLEIVSHEQSDVRVVADTTGWGGYAVEIDATERDGNVKVVGRVDGALHWMFGGPTVDVRIEVPAEYAVKAHIAGGPMLLEDLGGAVEARVDDSDLAVHRIEGPVRLTSGEGAVAVEDVDGALRIENGSGPVQISGLRGRLEIRAEQGQVDVESVTGSVDIASSQGEISLERVKGKVRVASDRAQISIEDLEGELDVRTDRGRISVEELDGPIRAHSGRGGIDVEFAGTPEGRIETERGTIVVVVPSSTAFSLEARTERGELEIDDDLDFEPTLNPDGTPAGWTPVEHPMAKRGREIAREVQTQVRETMEKVRRDLKDSGIDPDGFGDWGDWDWDAEDWGDWDPDAGDKDRERQWRQWRKERRRTDGAVGDVNGGGPALQLHTERGSIHLDEG